MEPITLVILGGITMGFLSLFSRDSRPEITKQLNPTGGLFGPRYASPLDMQGDVLVQAMSMNKSVEIDLRSFKPDGTPYQMTTRIK